MLSSKNFESHVKTRGNTEEIFFEIFLSLKEGKSEKRKNRFFQKCAKRVGVKTCGSPYDENDLVQ